MLVIGKRGAAGLVDENSLSSVKTAVDLGVDIVHVDVRLTKDNVPVLFHDASLKRTHGAEVYVSQCTIEELNRFTKDKPIATLDSLLNYFDKKILLMLEVRTTKTATVVADMLQKRYLDQQKRLENVMFASYRPSDLRKIRALLPEAHLALLHDNNPFTFMVHHRFLNLSAVGFHRLHTNRFAQEVARRAGIFAFCYTVNRPGAAIILHKKGYDGVITSFPDRILKAIDKA